MEFSYPLVEVSSELQFLRLYAEVGEHVSYSPLTINYTMVHQSFVFLPVVITSTLLYRCNGSVVQAD
jgi:hypothetical protein